MDRVAAGDIVELPEAVYRYGAGTMKLQVVSIRRPPPGADPDNRWIMVTGYEILWNGTMVNDLRRVTVLASFFRGGFVETPRSAQTQSPPAPSNLGHSCHRGGTHGDAAGPGSRSGSGGNTG